ncbi:MAG TPA: ferrous iron transporter B [Actinomycetaceae bacterium]|nr:ferrous iron transporter B [Actinomycetaceae bacterium]
MSHCEPPPAERPERADRPEISEHEVEESLASTTTATATKTRRIALVGTPNAGKTTLFNALAGTRARTGNYPGVTVARREATIHAGPGGVDLVLEDLPGSYSLDPISPDEQIVVDLLDPDLPEPEYPDAILVVADVTTLRRSLSLISHLLTIGLPTTVAVTFGDELARRGGSVDLDALATALGVPVLAVPAGDRRRLDALREHLADIDTWSTRRLPIPPDAAGLASWIESVLARASYVRPQQDARTRRIDDVLLHPVFGTLIFFAVMFLLFQSIFSWAAPVMELMENGFAALGGWVAAEVPIPWLASFLGDAIIGGIGGVLVFLPQIALLFLFIALLEGTGYMARAAFLMDRVMSRFGLEGRAFVALLSSLACAVPGIMATRTLPSARDRIATMVAAPLMTCSARIPVYVLLIGMLVPAETRFGPFGAQGLFMFALYLAGAFASLGTAWVFSRIGGRRNLSLPFYMEMPSYQMPRLSAIALSVGESCWSFVRKVGTVILATTVALWVLLNFPAHTDDDLAEAGIGPQDTAAVAAYQVDNSWAADVGRAIEPVFEPLGYDWRINVGIISSLAAREVFVATLGQITAASDPEDPMGSLTSLTVDDGPRAGEPLFTPAVTASVLAFFAFALQCMATVGVIRRETGGWKWPAITFGYQFALGWIAAFLAYTVVGALT